MDDPTIKLWVFPPSDFDAWCQLTGNDRSEIASHADYLAMIVAVQADQERQGRTVRRVRMTAAEMQAALAADGWPNDPQHRAAVIAAT